MEIHGRQGFGRWSFPLFYYAVAQTPIRALRIKHFRKAGRKNEYKEETGRQELAETGGRISLQGYRCTESRQPVLEELYHDPDSKLHAQGQKGGVTMPDTNMERERERHSPQVLVDTENLTREEWLDWRRRGIGGSDVSAIIGIPAIGIDGLIRGMQILLDVPFKDKDDPPEKAGTKYIWLSSSTKNMGVTSGSPVHFIGNPFARTIYVTEGILKADIAHVLLNRSFVAVAGANNVAQLGPLFGLLAQNGTELIIEAHDMDKYSNEMIAKGSSKIYLLARQQGMECRRLTWNPNYKGIDDWQLALRREKQQKEGGDQNLQKGRALFGQEGKELSKEKLNFPHRRYRFRIYQLCFDAGQETIPFAFKGIRDLHRAGYGQPPASEYRLVCDAELACPEE